MYVPAICGQSLASVVIATMNWGGGGIKDAPGLFDRFLAAPNTASTLSCLDLLISKGYQGC